VAAVRPADEKAEAGAAALRTRKMAEGLALERKPRSCQPLSGRKRWSVQP